MIELKEIIKRYDEKDQPLEILKGVNLTVEKGELIAIMGPSGSGKSTILNILGLLDRPTSGQFNFEGTPVTDLTDGELAVFRRQHIGFVFQKFNLLTKMNVLENVRLPLLLDHQDIKIANTKAKEMLDKVGMLDRLDHKPNELSGGEQQRVAIARALVNHPNVIIADEPTGNLDPKSEESVMQLFQSLHQEGTSIIVVTHSQKVSKYVQKVYVLKKGLLEEQGGSFYHKLLTEK